MTFINHLKKRLKYGQTAMQKLSIIYWESFLHVKRIPPAITIFDHCKVVKVMKNERVDLLFHVNHETNLFERSYCFLFFRNFKRTEKNKNFLSMTFSSPYIPEKYKFTYYKKNKDFSHDFILWDSKLFVANTDGEALKLRLLTCYHNPLGALRKIKLSGDSLNFLVGNENTSIDLSKAKLEKITLRLYSLSLDQWIEWRSYVELGDYEMELSMTNADLGIIES